MQHFPITKFPNQYTQPEKHFLSKVFSEEILLYAEEARADLAKIWLEALESGAPYQYVIGKTVFYNLSLEVNPHVLIPRPETEEMVGIVLNKKPKPKTVLDIGTGSGCIAVALKKNLNKTTIIALDISLEALETAKRNALKNNVAIHFLHDDIISPKQIYGQFDLIVSNPPYIGEDEILDISVVNHEPNLALFALKDVLKYYKAIASFATGHLKPGGEILVEINQKYGNQTKAVFENNGFKATLLKDMSGNDRFVKASARK